MKQQHAKTARKRVKKSRNLVATIDQLIAACGVHSRDTYYRFRWHADAPKQVGRQYDATAWRDFFKSQGVMTDDSRREQIDTAELKRQITMEDLEARRDQRLERRRLLIPRAEHEDFVLSLAGAFTNSRENLRARLQIIMGDSPAMREAMAVIDDEQETLKAIVAKVQADAAMRAKQPADDLFALAKRRGRKAK